MYPLLDQELSEELNFATGIAPYVNDPDNISNLMDKYIENYKEKTENYKEGKSNLTSIRQILFIAVAILIAVAGHFTFTAAKGTGIIVLDRFIPWIIASTIVAIALYIVACIKTRAKKLAAESAREALVRVVGLYQKNRDYIVDDPMHVYSMRNAISALTAATL